jgi:hypothetical protein
MMIDIKILVQNADKYGATPTTTVRAQSVDNSHRFVRRVALSFSSLYT